jgi:hypothetical protein
LTQKRSYNLERELRIQVMGDNKAHFWSIYRLVGPPTSLHVLYNVYCLEVFGILSFEIIKNYFRFILNIKLFYIYIFNKKIYFFFILTFLHLIKLF